VEEALGAGVEVALSGPDPYDGASPRRVELMDHAALAPFAMFLAIAMADGELEKSEVEAFIEAMSAVTDPLLTEIMGASKLSAHERLTRLMEDKGDLADRSIFAMGVALAEEAGGEAARAALMALLTPVAAGRPTEQKVLDGIAAAISDAGQIANDAAAKAKRPAVRGPAVAGPAPTFGAPSDEGGSSTAVFVIGAILAVALVLFVLWAFGG
jgi:hypothetical protein